MLIVTPTLEDLSAWRLLYNEYALFYKVEMNDEIADSVWSWLHEPNHVLEGVLAKLDDGELVGFAHFRPVPDSLMGKDIGFLDDLYVAEKHRRKGIAEVLMKYVAEKGKQRDWKRIIWNTNDNNYRARSLYDRLGVKTPYLTYQMPCT